MSLVEPFTIEAVLAAVRQAARGKTLSADTRDFLLAMPSSAIALHRELCDGSYRPGVFRSFQITDPKPRLISAAPFRDRVVHHALISELESLFERAMLPNSWGCRRGKGTHKAVHAVQQMVRSNKYALRMDVRHFFETLDHEVLVRLLFRRIKSPSQLALAKVFATQVVPGSAHGKGVAIGNLTSQHFANLYLSPLDRHIVSGLRCKSYARYMDDLVLLGDNAAQLWEWACAIDMFARNRLQLTMKHAVTSVTPVHAGIPFLGFRIYPGTMRLDSARTWRFLKRYRSFVRLDARGGINDHVEARCRSLLSWVAMANTWHWRKSVN